jgi:hypothetical protein
MPQSERVKAPWHRLVLLCKKCDVARGGPDAREVRKQIKRTLGKSKQLRVLPVGCLDVCPRGALTVCISDARNGTVDLRLVRSREDVALLCADLESGGDR